MSVTVDCGEGKHTICCGRGRTAYLFPQESRGHDEEPFYCGCRCHHDGRDGCVPCSDPVHAASPSERSQCVGPLSHQCRGCSSLMGNRHEDGCHLAEAAHAASQAVVEGNEPTSTSRPDGRDARPAPLPAHSRRALRVRRPLAVPVELRRQQRRQLPRPYRRLYREPRQKGRE